MGSDKNWAGESREKEQETSKGGGASVLLLSECDELLDLQAQRDWAADQGLGDGHGVYILHKHYDF